jgi:hypothetical protein
MAAVNHPAALTPELQPSPNLQPSLQSSYGKTTFAASSPEYGALTVSCYTYPPLAAIV